MEVTIKEISIILGKPRRFIYKRRKKEGWKVTGFKIVNYKKTEVFNLNNLPVDVQASFNNNQNTHQTSLPRKSKDDSSPSSGFHLLKDEQWQVEIKCPEREGAKRPINPAIAHKLKFLSDKETDMIIYSSAPEWAKKKADKYRQILNASEDLKGEALKKFISDWNQRHPAYKTSYSRVLDIRKSFTEQGISGLLAQYGKSAGRTLIKDEWFPYFKKVYLVEGAPSLLSCWRSTLGHAINNDGTVDIKNFPVPASFKRRLDNELPKDSIYLARYGEAAWNRKYANYIDRDYSSLSVGECYVSDHAQVDVAVISPNGKPCFPWITAYRDFKSGKWVGWTHNAEAPNSDHIFQAFYYAVDAWGVPSDIYIDNGRDYRCRDFAGGRKHHKITLDAGKAVSMLSLLKITPHFSLPYNAQAKTIERDFLKNKEWFSKHVPGYRGGHTKERPEKLKDEIKTGKIFHWDDYVKLMDDFILNVSSVR